MASKRPNTPKPTRSSNSTFWGMPMAIFPATYFTSGAYCRTKKSRSFWSFVRRNIFQSSSSDFPSQRLSAISALSFFIILQDRPNGPGERRGILPAQDIAHRVLRVSPDGRNPGGSRWNRAPAPRSAGGLQVGDVGKRIEVLRRFARRSWKSSVGSAVLHALPSAAASAAPPCPRFSRRAPPRLPSCGSSGAQELVRQLLGELFRRRLPLRLRRFFHPRLPGLPPAPVRFLRPELARGRLAAPAIGLAAKPLSSGSTMSTAAPRCPRTRRRPVRLRRVRADAAREGMP